ncbi:YciI family protein [Streptomyces sp. DSM 44915]|uniref:YciI family protein n=1 Tax=Streptomyces chisholmiae TaxID=3075540 RepID=A0ABU2JT84_9ACTN|nr:YciI family protein [Streptomyces sp. DSM 44915]MDT0268200.1 YciI family protein [Streptomyces sp. DSM 44915]
MQYMVQIASKASTWEADMAGYSEADTEALFAFMAELNEELQRNGELVDARGLGGPGAATTVQATDGGEPRVSEGLDAGREEILAGYWVIEVSSHERAVEIAHRLSTCPGVGGKPSNEPVELHALPVEPA